MRGKELGGGVPLASIRYSIEATAPVFEACFQGLAWSQAALLTVSIRACSVAQMLNLRLCCVVFDKTQCVALSRSIKKGDFAVDV